VTLPELLIALGITGIVMLVIVTLSVSTGRSLAEMFNYVDLDHSNRIAIDVMSRDLRQVRYLSSYNTNSVTFVDKDDTAITYAYSPTTRLFTRTKAGQVNTLLDNCDSLKFALYQRTPQSNNFNLYTISDITNCKVVSVTWSCSRKVLGIKANTEQAQAARIVIRNKKEEN
jgi:type II secretory pathway component PulJ